MVSPATTLTLAPLTVKEPAPTWASFSKRGRRFGSALLKVAFGSTSVWVVADGRRRRVWLLVSMPAANAIDRPKSSPR